MSTPTPTDDAKQPELELLTPERGAKLIADRTGGNPDDAVYRQISAALGGVMTAITLAAAHLAEGHVGGVGELLRLIENHQASENPFADLVLSSAEKNPNLEKAFSLSYAVLDSDLRRRFRALGVLPSRSAFDVTLAAALWQETAVENVREPLETLARMVVIGLLPEIATSSGQEPPKFYTLDPLLAPYARALLIREQELDATFIRYADHITAQAAQFSEQPAENWAPFEWYLALHLVPVGDGLMRRFRSMAQPDGELARRASNFAANVAPYLLKRRAGLRIEWLEMGLTAARAAADQEREALFLSEIGLNRIVIGSWRDALGYFEQALPIYAAIGDPIGQAKTLNNLGSIWIALDEPHKAPGFHEQALQSYREAGDRAKEAKTLLRLGQARLGLGEIAQAQACFEQALPIFQSIDDNGQRIYTLNCIGMTWKHLSEPQKALASFEQALYLSQTEDSTSQRALSANNIGMTLSDLGEKRKGLQFVEEALTLYRAMADKSGEAMALGNLGKIWNDLGEKHKALEYHRQAVPLYRLLGNHALELALMVNVATTLWELGELEKALQYAQNALAVLKANNLPNKSGGLTAAQIEGFIERIRREGRRRTTGFASLLNVFRPRKK